MKFNEMLNEFIDLSPITNFFTGGVDNTPLPPSEYSSEQMSKMHEREVASKPAPSQETLETNVRNMRAAMQERENMRAAGDWDMDGKIDRSDINAIAQKYSKEVGVPEDVVRAIIEKESGGKFDAISRANRNGTRDYGVMQLNSNNFQWFKDKFWSGEGDFNPLNPVHNIEIGVKYLKWLNDYFDGDWEKTVMGYNAGPGAVRRGTIPNMTRNYLAFVQRRATDTFA